MILDETGTITQGSPKVTNIHLIQADSEDEVLRLAASLEAGSEHPLSLSIVESATERNLSLDKVEQFSAIAGQGVEGFVGGAATAVWK